MSEVAERTWKTETRRLGDLVPRADNPRELTREQARHLQTSLRKFGYSQLIEINPDNTILDGHQRDMLMLMMAEFGAGFELEVRVAYPPMTREEWQEYTVRRHEGGVARWDWDGLAEWEGVGVAELTEWAFAPERLFGAGVGLEGVEFPEYDESVADEVEFVECPECGHKWPK